MFDGHAGMDAAIFAAKHLHCLLTQKCDLDSDPGEALRSAFKVTDEAFIQKAKREVSYDVSPRPPDKSENGKLIFLFLKQTYSQIPYFFRPIRPPCLLFTL